jgi:alpha/beta hydrolase fold
MQVDGTAAPEDIAGPAGGRSRWIDLDGPVHYVDFGGPEDGPGIVCVHGLGGSAVNWSAIAPLLTGRYRLLAPDLAGHGLTRPAARRRRGRQPGPAAPLRPGLRARPGHPHGQLDGRHDLAAGGQCRAALGGRPRPGRSGPAVRSRVAGSSRHRDVRGERDARTERADDEPPAGHDPGSGGRRDHVPVLRRLLARAQGRGGPACGDGAAARRVPRGESRLQHGDALGPGRAAGSGTRPPSPVGSRPRAWPSPWHAGHG